MPSDDDISDLSEDFDISGVDQADVDAWVSEDEGFLAPPPASPPVKEDATPPPAPAEPETPSQDEVEELEEPASDSVTEEPVSETDAPPCPPVEEAQTPEAPVQSTVSDPQEDQEEETGVTPNVDVDLRSEEPTPNTTPAVEDKEIDEMFDDMEEEEAQPARGGGWGGWGLGGWAKSAISNVTQSVSAAGEELGIKELAKNTVSSISAVVAPEAESSRQREETEDASEEEDVKQKGPAIENNQKREQLFAKLEGDDSLERNLKALDDKVEKLATNAWSAFGKAWTGASKLATSAANELKQGIDEVKDTNVVQGVAANTASITSKIAMKGTNVLEGLGQATMDFLNVNGDNRAAQSYMDQLSPEEATFERCFYIYGGPEHLEELEALGEEETMRCNRQRAKMSSEEKEQFDNMLSDCQDLLNLDLDADCDDAVEEEPTSKPPEDDKQVARKNPLAQLALLREQGLSQAADMEALAKQSLCSDCSSGEVPQEDIVELGGAQLDAIKAEGVQRISEIATTCMLQLLHIGASISDRHLPGTETIEWEPEPASKATWVRARGRKMVAALESISEAFTGALSTPLEGVVEEGPNFAEVSAALTASSERLRKELYSDTGEATSRVQEGVQHLLYVIMATTVEKTA